MADYDAWQKWIETDVFGALGDCAIRHQAVVDAWPK
jgi:hypothetical protein